MRTAWLLVIAILGLGGIGYGKSGVSVKPVTKVSDIRINPKDGAKMVWVPEGEFTMGGTVTADEKPQRTVYLDGYWMYKYEVTVAQYRKFCKATKRKMPEPPERGVVLIASHPMVYVTWQDAADYAKWAGVTLPTEAQWEKAARGTDGRTYPWGNDWDASKCASSAGTWLKSTKPIGSYPAGVSPYGCMDMAGNAWEWCADWYEPNYYKNAPSRNPKGPTTTGYTRVLRGGSWRNADLDPFRCAYRSNIDPSSRYRFYGFRCAKAP